MNKTAAKLLIMLVLLSAAMAAGWQDARAGVRPNRDSGAISFSGDPAPPSTPAGGDPDAGGGAIVHLRVLPAGPLAIGTGKSWDWIHTIWATWYWRVAP